MAELRREPVIGRWAVVHTDDSVGPEGYEKEEHVSTQAETCQFCYGKEKNTPPEVDVVRPGHTAPNSSGWQVRVVPNKFPALRIEGNLDKRGVGIFGVLNGIGAHEVVIETPDHCKDTADFSDQEILHVIQKYQSRYLSLARDRRFKYIMIFKNFGESAGASLEHPHSQIIALPMVPKNVLEEIEGAQTYHDFRGRCVFCDIIHQEYKDKERIIAENEHFIAFCPFVPQFPFECWIMPKRHSSDFGSLSHEEQSSVGILLREVLSRLKVALSIPSYNYYFHVSPVNSEGHESYHWHIEVLPNLTRVAGFEWGTGFYLVKTSPSAAAKYLREAAVSVVR